MPALPTPPLITANADGSVTVMIPEPPVFPLAPEP
jgi:hypothetical protein